MLNAEVARVVVVDNGSPADTVHELSRWAQSTGTVFCGNPENLGVAAALNQGIALASQLGAEWVLTLDQDSELGEGAVAALQAMIARHPERSLVGLVGANVIEKALGGRATRWAVRRSWRQGWFAHVPCDAHDLDDVLVVITSGCLTRVAMWEQIGGFEEALFVDYIDTDFCLRAHAAGWLTCVSAQARLYHALGRRSVQRVAGMELRPMNHVALRRYYIGRNRIWMLKRHGFRDVSWLVREILVSAFSVVRIVMAERGRWGKLRAEMLGSWHGILGKHGKAPESVARRFGV